MSALADQVFATLETDAKYRDEDALVDGADLHTFDKLFGSKTVASGDKKSDKNRRNWDFSLPTVSSRWLYSGDTMDRRETLGSFVKMIREDFPELKHLNFDNLLIAGGIVGHYLTHKKVFDGDVDIFIYGVTPAQATELAKRAVKDLIAGYKTERIAMRRKLEMHDDDFDRNMKKRRTRFDLISRRQLHTFLERDDFGVRMVRNENGITLYLGNDRKYQIIFRVYKNKTSVLHGFDLGSSAVGFDGKQVYFTSLSLLSFRYFINVVDTTRRSTTYEHRLEKYLDRGFLIVLPDFDTTKLRRDYLYFNRDEIAVMPTLAIVYDAIEGKNIEATNLIYGHELKSALHKLNGQNKQHESVPKKCEIEYHVARSDYGLMDSIADQQLIELNARYLICAPEKMYHVVAYNSRLDEQLDEDGKAMVEDKENQSHRDEDNAKVDQFFVSKPTLALNQLKSFYENLPETLFDDTQINVAKLERYVDYLKVPEVLTMIFTQSDDDLSMPTKAQTKEKLKAILQEQQAQLVKKWHNHMDQSFAIEWMTKNPGRQHTSSFNPIFEDPEKWYGDYYAPSAPSLRSQ